MLNTCVYKRIFRGCGGDGFQTNEGNIGGRGGGKSRSVRRSYHRITGPGWTEISWSWRGEGAAVSSLSHRRSRGPTVTRDHANLSLVPFHEKQKYSKRAKPAGRRRFLRRGRKRWQGISMWYDGGGGGGGREGGLPNRSFLSMCIHLRLAWVVSRVWIMLVTLDLTLFKRGGGGRKNYAKPFIEPLAPGSPLATRRISFSYS